MSWIKITAVISLSLWITAFAFIDTDKKVTTPAGNISFSDSLSGKHLAAQYCASCHLFPDPALLDKNTWVTSVLPNMGLRLGIHEPGTNPYDDLKPEEVKAMQELNIYPETASLSNAEWQKIVSYYQIEAPAEPLPQMMTTTPVTDQLPLFKSQEITLGDKSFPQTTLLKFDKATSQFYIGDAQNTLYVLDNQFQVKDTWWVESAPTDIDFPKNAAPRLLTIGVFKPSEQKSGRLMSLEKTASSSAINIKSLPRPVQFASADINLDGKEDAILSGFGNHSGKLFWYDDFQSDKEHILKALPGARKAEISDFNRDKKPDIIALMAQAREEISIFYNLGNGKFKEKVLLRFPPAYGMSYFELVDFNKDGFQDILLTNGDNWDLSPVLKNYHGIRIYLNDGKDNFKEAFFYPLYGASKAVARDFDLDGDLDIAATSFYSDLENPAHGFIYLSNEGKLTFKALATPEAANGKWLTMEAADFDQDGDIDIVLGSYFHTIGEMTRLMAHGILSFPQLLVLTNQKK